MSISTAVIPVAGLGTRMLPVSRLVPKEFLPLGRKPAIQLVAEELLAAGIRRFVFVVSPRKTSLCNLFGDNENRLAGFEDSEFEFVIQEEQLGLGHAILCAAETVGDNAFAVALGDCLVGLPGQTDLLKQLINKKGDNRIAIGFEPVPQKSVSRYGIAITQSKESVFDLQGVVEKPDADVAPSNLAVCGRYVFDGEIFAALRQTSFDAKREIQLTDAINRMINESTTGIGVRVPDGVRRYDIGNMESYVSAFAQFAFHDETLREKILAVGNGAKKS